METNTEDIMTVEKSAYKDEVKSALLKRFGATYDPESDQIKKETEYNQVVLNNMGGNCNTVSSVVKRIVKGEIYELTVTGDIPTISYDDNGLSREVARVLHKQNTDWL